MTKPPLTAETRLFWEQYHTWKRKFPYWVETSATNPVAELIHPPGARSPHPRYGRFYRLTYADRAFWGFETFTGRVHFIASYPEATPWLT